jgi:hypothetical protein
MESSGIKYNIGDLVFCKRTLLNEDREVVYKKGLFYKSDKYNCITDNNCNKNHIIEARCFNRNFYTLEEYRNKRMNKILSI